jgi:hypothetical protein
VNRNTHSTLLLWVAVVATLGFGAALVGCSGGGKAGASGSSAGSTSGASYTIPSSIQTSSFSKEDGVSGNGASIDVSSASKGYFAALASNSSRLKLQVTSGNMSYNYDLPNDGTPIACPVNMGDGTYTVRVMQNTSGNNYVEIDSATVDVKLDSEFEPFLRPNVYCDYSDGSACVAQARQLAQGAKNQGDVLQSVCTYITGHIKYDSSKATRLRSATGYVPDPDATLADGTGICFDYASLGAAMLRSLGIPCKVVTGYVSPNNLYHAWIMVYIDGSWTSAEFKVDARTWSRVDLTFAAAGGPSEFVGDASSYTDRYTY